MLSTDEIPEVGANQLPVGKVAKTPRGSVVTRDGGMPILGDCQTVGQVAAR